jgi:hypothetical protein
MNRVAAYGRTPTTVHEQDAFAVADAVLCKLAGPLTMPLSKIQRLPLRASDYNEAKRAKPDVWPRDVLAP